MFFTIPKLISLILGLIVIAKTLTDFKKKQENWQMFLFWLVLWIAIIVVAFYPMIIDKMIDRFGAGSYTIGQIVGISFVFIMFIVYRVYVKAQYLEKHLNQLIRKIALKDLKRHKQK